jgi:alpha-glucosidase (family GH31 glycosyl hydrolase)
VIINQLKKIEIFGILYYRGRLAMASLGEHFIVNKETLISDPKVIFKGVNYRITVLSERLIRFEYALDGEFYDGATEIVHNRKFTVPKVNVQQDENFLVLSTKYFILQYAKEKPFKGPSFAPDSNLKVKLANTDKVWYYNHPEARNFKGSAFSIEDFGDKTDLSKGLYSTDGFAFLDDSSTLHIDDNGFLYQKNNKNLDFYLFVYRRDFGLCLKDYFTLTGNPPIIPRYALGIWWNRDQIYTFEDTKKVVKSFSKNDIPLSVLLLGEFWHNKDPRNYNLYKTGYSFNKELFKEPKEFIKYMHDNKIRVGLNLDCCDGINSMNEGYNQMCTELGVEPGNVIPFNVLDPNFVVSYFKNLINPLYEIGVDFFWLDSKDKGLTRILNYYHFNDYKKFKDKRGMILSRNGGKSAHLYPVHYSGETKVGWDTLRYLPIFNSTASNIGLSWWSHDVGGYKGGIEDSELYMRYVELSTFSPIFRFSSRRGAYYKREPWRWDMKTYTIVKEYCKLRHKLIPYIYTEGYKYYKTFLPLVQPLYYYYPEIYDEPSYRNEYYFGTELLVSPITKPKDAVMNRAVEKIFLPKGVWYDFKTGKRFTGNKRYISFFKDEDFPVFAKSGAIIPLAIIDDDLNNIDAPKKMEIHIFPGSSNVYRLYEDDGYSSEFEDKMYIITAIDFNYSNDNYNLSIQPVDGKTGIITDMRDYKIRFRNTRLPERVSAEINGQEVKDVKYYNDDNDLVIEINNVDTRKQLTVNCVGKNIEIDAVRIINEDINEIISDLKIETYQKERIAAVIFSNLSINRKRIEIRKLKRIGINPIFIKMFIKLLEYIEQI